MPRITGFTVLSAAEQAVVTADAVLEQKALPGFLEEAFGKLELFVRQKKVIPADTPYCRFSAAAAGTVSVQLGLAVPEPLAGTDGITAGTLPGGTRIACYCLGESGGLEMVWQEMTGYARQLGLKPDGAPLEYCLNGPEFGADRLLTRLVMCTCPAD